MTSWAGRARSQRPPPQWVPAPGVWGGGSTLSNFRPGSFPGSNLSPTLSSPPPLSCQARSAHQPSVQGTGSGRDAVWPLGATGHPHALGRLPTRPACCVLVAPGSCTALDAHLLSGHRPEPPRTFHLGLRHAATPTACRLGGRPDSGTHGEARLCGRQLRSATVPGEHPGWGTCVCAPRCGDPEMFPPLLQGVGGSAVRSVAAGSLQP